MQRVVFLDRDGVINRDSPDYVKSWEEFHFLPGSLQALKLLKRSGFAAIVVTNQSAVNRNLLTESALQEMHRKMCDSVEEYGGSIEDIFYCPHRPEEGCLCRKPKPGLIEQARKRYRIALSDAWMVGDSVKDIECARNAGCRHAVLVRTGSGRPSERILMERKTPPDYVAEDLFGAVEWIIGRRL
ncbi:MAG: D-glycero-beta-D-manno-heptose 1,7-bisphosphate 7-phosphatase [Desulfobacteraceae bacterium]|nr:MAG: D-glycero-beta-D-manno-heptose 1,7-bisphosphate 7-phosphatase [Desulfobacteraceae bacterium]